MFDGDVIDIYTGHQALFYVVAPISTWINLLMLR